MTGKTAQISPKVRALAFLERSSCKRASASEAKTPQGHPICPAIAVIGESSVGTGVQGVSHGFSGIGVEGLANDGAEGTGVHGQANGANGAGVLAELDEGTAIVGLSTRGVGGVFSAGASGVQSGDAPPGRAGVFGSDSAAQVRLVPHKPLTQPALNEAYSVQALISKGLTAEFPANGQAGSPLFYALAPGAPVSQ